MLSKNQIKWINSFKIKKYRQLHGCFIAEGTKLAEELITNRYPIQTVFATQSYLDHHKNLVSQIKAEIVPITANELKKVSTLSTPNDILIIAKQKELSTPQYDGKISLLLDDVSDPGNLGTIIRIADWFGIEHVVCSKNCVDVFNPKVVQSTMGSLVRVHVSYQDLFEILDNHQHINSYATSLDGVEISNSIKTEEAFIILGNESKGISRALQEKANYKIKIKGSGQAESLNVAIAAGIMCNTFCN